MKKYLIPSLILIFLAGGFFLPRDFNSKEQIVFRVEKGEGSKDIALNLEKEGFIWWGQVFRIYVLATGRGGKLQAGNYFFSPSMNISQIARKLSSGDIAKAKITIPEGFTFSQIAQILSRTVLAGIPARTILDTLEKYEGYLFPDTYEINYGATGEEIVKIMTDNFNKKTSDLKITPEIVVMASILEKELKTKEDKELASGILWKRSKVGIPLQVDAHLWTYENYGLPPKPIANPGLDSILAALYPKDSPYWYYLSKSDGATIFSKTLEEHNTAKVKYLP